jgi:hypothetical protein
MEKLILLVGNFKELRMQGWSSEESAKRAVNNVFSDTLSKPYIHTDKYEEPSHIFFKNYVMFFDGEIYERTIY